MTAPAPPTVDYERQAREIAERFRASGHFVGTPLERAIKRALQAAHAAGVAEGEAREREACEVTANREREELWQREARANELGNGLGSAYAVVAGEAVARVIAAIRARTTEGK